MLGSRSLPFAWGGRALDAVCRTRELGGEVDFLPTRPAIGEAVAREVRRSNRTHVAGEGTVPVHRLVEVQDDARRVGILLEGVALHADTVGGSELDTDLIGLKGHGIVARLRHLRLVGEARVDTYGSLLLSLQSRGYKAVIQSRQGNREEGYIVEVACARTTQMGVAEACDGAVGVEVTSNIVPASAPIVGAELHHTKGRRSSWVDVPHPVGTDEGIHTLSK